MVFSIAIALFSLAGCNNEPTKDLPPPCVTPLVVTTPAPGTWIEANSIQVQGNTCDLDFVEVQGNRIAPQPDGSFSAFIDITEGINTIEVLGLAAETPVEMQRFSVLQGTFGETGALMQKPLHTHLNPAGVDTIAELVTDMFKPEDVNAALENMNPLVEQALDFGVVLDTEVHANTIDFSSASLALNLNEARIGVDLRITDLHLWGQLQADLNGEPQYDERVEAYADLIIVSGYITPSVMDGELHLEATEVEARWEEFGFDVSGFSNWIEENVLTAPLQDLLENVAVESVHTIVVPELESAFSSLAIDEAVTILDIPIDFSTTPVLVEVDHAGMDLSLDMVVSGPGEAHQSPKGPLAVPSTAASLAQNETIGIGLHDNALNSALHELWRAGGFDLNFSTVDESLNPIVRTLLESDDVLMTLDFQLPPVLTATPEGLVLSFGELVADLQTPNGALGESATLALDGAMRVDAQFEEGEFTIGFENIEAMVIVRDNDWGMGTVEASTTFSSRVPMSMALSMMSDLSFPMPSLSDIGLNQVEISRSGETPETVLSLK